MLEEMGESGPALRLAADAHVVDDRHADDWCAAIRREHHPQAVVEGEPFDRVPGRGDLHLARHAMNITRRGTCTYSGSIDTFGFSLTSCCDRVRAGRGIRS
jgi:hypothetical protein